MTRWLSPGAVLPWFAKHCVCFTACLEQESPTCKHSIVWWLSLLDVHWDTDDLKILFKSFHGSTTLAHQQTALFLHFIQSLCEHVIMEDQLLAQQVASWHWTSGCRRGSFAVSGPSVKLIFYGLDFLELLVFWNYPLSIVKLFPLDLNNLWLIWVQASIPSSRSAITKKMWWLPRLPATHGHLQSCFSLPSLLSSFSYASVWRKA